jgi:hypothetical protein
MPLPRARARQLAAINGIARCVVGGAALALPRLPLAPWVGEARDNEAVRLLARALGGRDLALGVGVLLALRKDAPARGWVEAGALADAGDVLVTLAALKRLPRRGRWVVLASASAGVLAAALTSPAVDAVDALTESASSASASGGRR